MSDRLAIGTVLALQAICAVFFVSDIALGVFGLRAAPIAWQTQELLELGAALGLLLGLLLGAVALARTRRRSAAMEARLRAASGAFMEVLDDRFTLWGLTPAERDVALFVVKGFSTAEIAELRQTAAGTVKAQTNAIYRKSGTTGRAQLISLFVEELMAGGLPPETGSRTAARD